VRQQTERMTGEKHSVSAIGQQTFYTSIHHITIISQNEIITRGFPDVICAGLEFGLPQPHLLANLLTRHPKVASG
jgi:hypothetical protein